MNLGNPMLHHLRAVTMIFSFSLILIACNDEDDCTPGTKANAGPDQVVTTASTTLAGNTPGKGVGIWTIKSGAGGIIAEPNNPLSSFEGVIGNSYILEWQLPGCPVTSDEVQISFTCDPTKIANAGEDKIITGSTSTTLAATGAGIWSIISGEGGNLANPSSATTGFTGVAGTTYTLRWTVEYPESQDDVTVTFDNGNPQLVTLSKQSVINGEIITITGLNFAANYNGGSQIVLQKASDPLAGQQVFLPIISRTETEIKAVILGTNGGASGVYNILYQDKANSGNGTFYNTPFNVAIIEGANGFFTTSTFTSTNVTKGQEASFGIKNGTLVAADYSVKLIDYDYTTGSSISYDAAVTSIVANGFGGSMDKLAFTVPGDLPSGSYYVKVIFNEQERAAGWNFSLNVN